MGLMNQQQYKAFREQVKREEEEKRLRRLSQPPKRDWIAELGDEIEKHPILPPRVRRRC